MGNGLFGERNADICKTADQGHAPITIRPESEVVTSRSSTCNQFHLQTPRRPFTNSLAKSKCQTVDLSQSAEIGDCSIRTPERRKSDDVIRQETNSVNEALKTDTANSYSFG